MIIERGKVYGYSYEELQSIGSVDRKFELGIKVDNPFELSSSEIYKMFPNQTVIVKVTKCKDWDNPQQYEEGVVLYFNTDISINTSILERLQAESPNDVFIIAGNWDERYYREVDVYVD